MAEVLTPALAVALKVRFYSYLVISRVIKKRGERLKLDVLVAEGGWERSHSRASRARCVANEGLCRSRLCRSRPR